MFNIVLLKSHIDFSKSESSDVITHSMDTMNLILLDPRKDQRVNMFYMKGNVKLYDSIFQMGREPVKKETY